MDAVMDLTARAVSFITLIQDTFLRASVRSHTQLTAGMDDVFGNMFKENFTRYMEVAKDHERENRSAPALDVEGNVRPLGYVSKIIELVWFSGQKVKEDDKRIAESYTVDLCSNLVAWIKNNKTLEEKLGKHGVFSPPFIWRKAISEIIYLDKDERVSLAQALEYVPIHVVLALGGGNYEAGEQRVLQWWQINNKQRVIGWTDEEQNLHKKFRASVYKGYHPNDTNISDCDVIDHFYSDRIIFLLSNYSQLTLGLLNHKAPLPFEYIFNSELDEIKESRKLREKELLLADTDPTDNKIAATPDVPNSSQIDRPEVDPLKKKYSCDPFSRAYDMKLFALAFSGGGIRSATFNLGVIQAFAKKGIISHVDYLSTVSGGGYIGSWLATWIKRDGSVKKVTDRLNPEKSADPLGEEVRAIRWLRMFSNYFTPNKSLMSVDSWTVGVTWLRNTLLNQLVIFFVLLSALMVVRASFELWQYTEIWSQNIKGSFVFVISSILLLVLALLTGVGMNWFNRGQPVELPFNLHNNNSRVTISILSIAVVGSYLISASFFSQPMDHPYTYLQKAFTLLPAAFVTLAVLLIIAIFGRYDKCITSLGKPSNWAIVIIVGTAVAAAAISLACLAAGWQLFEYIKTAFGKDNPVAVKFAFTAGLPIVLLVFGITVVSRMALLGKYFPDERREWWGRMGAVINRFAFIWLLVAASTFLMRDVLDSLIAYAPASIGGWMVLVAGTVRAAFSSKTSGEKQSNTLKSKALNFLSMAGPYLFALGILIFLPGLVEPLINQFDFYPNSNQPKYLEALALAGVFFIPAFFMSMRLGVNEFSMHHFYRNRLVRAYLGATRRKSSREKSANPFTGFDRLDDEKLSKFKHDFGYYGPYPILNTALNASQASDLSRQDRKAESFIFSPLYCGFDFSRVRSSVNSLSKSYDYGYRPTEYFAYPNDNGPGIGTAMAISGAAVNANQGYHSSAGTAFLLTVFNVQMGWWIGNPRKNKWQHSDPPFGLAYLVYNLTGQSNTKKEFVCLSDGGHFDNMGLYEMVRRRCSYIIVCDGEQDDNFTCEGFANAIRKCRIDFGAEITINVDDIVNREDRFSAGHYAIGKIRYSGDTIARGTILYIKSSISGDEPVDVREYALKNPTFPQQTTADQFFDEQQFESYRKLGMHIADKILSEPKVIDAFGLKLKPENVNGELNDAIGRPVKKLFNTLKEFFVKKGDDD